MVLVFVISNLFSNMYNEINAKQRSQRTNSHITCGMSEHYMPKDGTSIIQRASSRNAEMMLKPRNV